MMPIRLLGLIASCMLLTTPIKVSAHTPAHGQGAHGAHGKASTAARPYVASEVVDLPFGRRGDPRQVSRTLTTDMGDNMRFSPDALTLKRGETVRLKVVNKGQQVHEYVLGTPAEIRKHWEMMKKTPDMAHDEPYMVHVQPKRQGELIWQFTQAGEFEFACLLPGHFEAGMVGKVVVR